MIVIKHLSIAVDSPARAAQILADLTGGTAQPFKTRTTMRAWVCLWNAEKHELIELLPRDWVMYPTSEGASFKEINASNSYNATHIQLETFTPLHQIQAIADKHGCQHYPRVNPRFGGPLYEVWIEEDFLIEFVSDEISNLK